MLLLAMLLTLVIWGLILWLLWWGLERIAVPEPFNKVCVVILVIASIVIVIGVLTGSIAPFSFLNGLIK